MKRHSPDRKPPTFTTFVYAVSYHRYQSELPLHPNYLPYYLRFAFLALPLPFRLIILPLSHSLHPLTAILSFVINGQPLLSAQRLSIVDPAFAGFRTVELPLSNSGGIAFTNACYDPHCSTLVPS